MKYYIETMGCQMNERDSETVAGMLSQLGYDCVNAAGRETALDCADVVVINTCSVRENADNRFFGLLGRVKRVKSSRPDTLVAVCGCMMQQQHIVDHIKEKFPWVDIVFGTHNIHEFPDLVKNSIGEKKKCYSVLPDAGEIVERLPVSRQHDFKAYVSIMFGCDNYCSYCIVPYTRGRERSRMPEEILREVRELCTSGVREITLLGQNVNSYRGVPRKAAGASPEENTVDFAKLLALVDDSPGLERIRFMTSHPKDFSDGLIRAFAELRHLCPAVHLPVQSGSSRVLESMNRNYTSGQYLRLVERLRAARPGIAITTDLIVGFPGETEDDFEETMALIEAVRFDAAFTFLFSPRRGTPAAEYGNQVPEDVKHKRFNRMVARLNDITLEKNSAFVGRELPLLVEGVSKTDAAMYAGRTPEGKLVNFSADGQSVRIGCIINVKITGVNTFSFTGRHIA